MTDLDDVFAPIEPPPGGLEGLRARMVADRRRRLAISVSVGVGLAALALLVVQPREAPVHSDHPSLATVAGPVEGRAETAVTVLSADDAVVVALVAGRPAGR